MNKVSIIVPIYNVEKYLDECIKSIVKQTYNNIEIILIDDGSTDNSSNICDKWENKDKRIIAIHKENGGLSSARNEALKIATGDYLAFIDSDDIIDEKMIETLVNLLETKQANISVCQFTRYLEGNKPTFSHLEETNIYNKNKALVELLYDKLTSHVCNKLFKKELFNDIEFPKGKNYEDLRTTYKIIEKCDKIVETKSELYGYMTRNSSISKKMNEKNLEDYIDAFNERFIYYEKNYPQFKKENIIGKIQYIYICYLKIADCNNKELLKNNKLIKEYNFLKKNLKKQIRLEYYKQMSKKQKIMINILLINPKIYYYTITTKIKLKENRKDKK